MKRRQFIGAAAAPPVMTLMHNCDAIAGNQSNATVRIVRDVHIVGSRDVVVCGGGPSGIAASIAAARAGKSVLLMDSQSQLGGTGTSGLVSHWLGGRLSDGSKWAVGGIFRSLSEEAAARGIALIPAPGADAVYQPHGWNMGQLGVGIPFDPFEMAAFLDDKTAKYGIEVLLCTNAVGVVMDGSRIGHVLMRNKSGETAIAAKTVVDATGDADITSFAGCEVKRGRDKDGLMTPATLMFHVDNVDQDTLSGYIHTHKAPRFRELIRELRSDGTWDFPYDIFISVQLTEKGTMMINTSRLTGIDGLDGQSVSDGLRRGRLETLKLMEIMRKNIPGFSHARLKAVAPMLGIRETRRIKGIYTLTVDDLVRGTEFEDAVGWSSYGWDLPDPKRPSYQPMTEKKVRKKLPVTPIPYRIMVPAGIDNLITPGRSVSVERDVLGPLRVSAPCFAMGEAAGTAAALAIDSSRAFSAVDVKLLRVELEKQGAVVDWTG
jgi:hypothetical protein